MRDDAERADLLSASRTSRANPEVEAAGGGVPAAASADRLGCRNPRSGARGEGHEATCLDQSVSSQCVPDGVVAASVLLAELVVGPAACSQISNAWYFGKRDHGTR
jgi:hypothetical protein